MAWKCRPEEIIGKLREAQIVLAPGRTLVDACCRIEHIFAHQKAVMGLFIRTIGIKRAEAKITLANLTFNMHRLIFHETRAMAG